MAEAEKKEQKQEQKKVSRIKTKKKFWFKIISPSVFGEKEIVLHSGFLFFPIMQKMKKRKRR